MASRIATALVFVLAGILVLTSCSSSDSVLQQPAGLTPASTMTELVSSLQSRFGLDLSNAATADHDFSDNSNAFAWAGFTDPIGGSYTLYHVDTNSANAQVILGPVDANRLHSVQSVDLTNGLTAEGISQGFYGVSTEDSTCDPSCPCYRFAWLSEGIASSNGVNLYRYVQLFLGYVVGCGQIEGHVYSYSGPGSVWYGDYYVWVVERLSDDPGIPPLGLALSYKQAWTR